MGNGNHHVLAPLRLALFITILVRTSLGRGHSACWTSGFSFEACCDPQFGTKGNPDCFDGLFTYYRCCLDEESSDVDGSLAALAGDCRQPNEIANLPKPVRCLGTAWVSAAEWERVFSSHKLSLSLGTSFKGWPNLGSILQKANSSSEALRSTEQDCISGLITIVLQTLPNIERTLGHEATMRNLAYGSRLRGAHAALQAVDCRWNSMVNHAIFDSYPLLLGNEPLFRAKCPAGLPRIFVYNTKDLAERPLTCSRTGFWASEVYVDRFLRQSACRTFDWEMADLFFVPAYLTCWELQKVEHLAAEEKEKEARRVAEKVQDLPHWHRRGGFDHVFLFGASSWQLHGWRRILAPAVILAVESKPIECAEANVCWHCTDCFQPWKDVVIPPLTPLDATRRLFGASMAVSNRTLIMSWHGQHANASDAEVQRAYRITNESVRLSILKLAHLPNVSIGGPVPAYAATLASSWFCLCPKGASSYTSRVFESILAGCIPVILSDDMRLPFDGLVDWANFSIRWPMKRANEEMYMYLKNLLLNEPEHVRFMQGEVAKVRCWFDYFYHLEDPLECSPYLGILRNLAARVRQQPRAPPAFVVSSNVAH